MGIKELATTVATRTRIGGSRRSAKKIVDTRSHELLTIFSGLNANRLLPRASLLAPRSSATKTMALTPSLLRF